jgi:O-antigen/teichoic acid export membrane protein
MTAAASAARPWTGGVELIVSAGVSYHARVMDTAPATSRIIRLFSLLNRPVVLLATGLGLSAAAGSGFLAVMNHSMVPALVAPLPGLYFLLAAIGTGMFAGFEQEMTRAVSRALALGQPERTVIRHQVRNAAWVGVVTVAVLCAAAPYVTRHWMYGHWVVFGELLIGLVGVWAAFLVRGLLSGRQQFRSYAITMVVEGLARLLPSIALALSGYGSTWAYGLIFALGSLVAAGSGLLVARAPITDGGPIPDAAQEPETANQAMVRLTRLTGGALAGQVLMYAVPLMVNGRLTTAPSLAVAVSSAVGLTRMALLILFPLQAPLLPKLTAAAARGQMRQVRRTTTALVAVCAGTGLAGIAVTGAVGPWVLRTIMGTKADLSAGFLMELSAGTLFLLVANVLQSALIALNRQQTVLVAWSLGVVAMGAVFALPMGVLTTAAVASIAGPAVTTLVMTFDVLRATRQTTPNRAVVSGADSDETERAANVG